MAGSRSTDQSRPDAPDLLLAHSSDLHLGVSRDDLDMPALRDVLTAARAAGAEALVLAGDIFDHNRVPLAVLDVAARLLADAALPVVILPGNHDCLTPDSVYRRGGLADAANVYVLGITEEESVLLAGLDLEIWGRAHLSHSDMSPLGEPRPRGSARWTVATAHGHWLSGPHDDHRSWLIRQEQLDALDSDYVALGHWDRALRVGTSGPPTYYSGSPDLARSINIVRFSVVGGVTVERQPLSATQAPRVF